MKRIHNYPDYSVTKDGRVYTHKRNKFMRFKNHRQGYKHVELRNEEGGKNLLIHRLVALAYIPNPESKPFINHIDGNKANNDISNLEWCTRSENTKHSYDLGLQKGLKGDKNPASVLKEKDILSILSFRKEGKTYQSIAEIFNVSKSTIGRIIKGKSWKHINN